MKILILGFQRSGTTLTKDLFNAHPQVKRIFHETQLLKHKKNELMRLKIVDDAVVIENTITKRFPFTIDFDLSTDIWGEKIPYYTNLIRGVNKTPIEYSRLWIQHFGDEARILNIIRHPYDVVFSTQTAGQNRKKLKDTGTAGISSVEDILLRYQQMVGRVQHQLSLLPNATSFKYEDLLLTPSKQLATLFSFAGLDCDATTIQEVLTKIQLRSDRVFAYKDKNTQRFMKVSKVLKSVQQIPGVQYEG